MYHIATLRELPINRIPTCRTVEASKKATTTETPVCLERSKKSVMKKLSKKASDVSEPELPPSKIREGEVEVELRKK